jgi:hypothetical protein
MLEEHSFEGEWWVPQVPARRVPGTLVFSGDGFMLTTKGALLSPPDGLGGGVIEDILELADIAVVLGKADSGPHITLLAVHGRRWMLPSGPGIRVTEVWRPETALIGGHVPASARFDEILVRTEHLDAWAGTPDVEGMVSFDEDGRLIQAKHKAVHHILDRANLPGFGIILEARPENRASEGERSLRQRAWFSVRPEAPVPVDEALACAGLLRGFLRLAVGRPCALESVRLRATECPAHTGPVWVDVLQRTTALLRGPAKRVNPLDLLFRRDTIPGGFESGLGRWIEIRARYGRALGLLTASDDARVIDAEEHLVGASRAIEVVHAADFGVTPTATAERDDRVERALLALPEDLKDWARPLLEASTPPVARHRLLEIVGTLGKTGEWLAGDDPERFAAYVIATRNFLVHPSASPPRRLISDAHDVFSFGRALRWLANLYLLQKLGIDQPSLDALARGKGEAAAAAGEVAEFLRLRASD